MTHWLKMHGTGNARLPDEWLPERGYLLQATFFPRRPRVKPGDELIYYAAGWHRLFAAVEVSEPPTEGIDHPNDPERWPWSVAIWPIMFVPRLGSGVPLDDIGVSRLSVRRQSHIKISADQFDEAVELLRRAGADLKPS